MVRDKYYWEVVVDYITNKHAAELATAESNLRTVSREHAKERMFGAVKYFGRDNIGGLMFSYMPEWLLEAFRKGKVDFIDSKLVLRKERYVGIATIEYTQEVSVGDYILISEYDELTTVSSAEYHPF